MESRLVADSSASYYLQQSLQRKASRRERRASGRLFQPLAAESPALNASDADAVPKLYMPDAVFISLELGG